MPFVLFGLLLLFHLLQTCDARDVYQSTWWIDDLYSKAENKSISVKLNSQLYFICPNMPTVVRMRDYYRQTTTMHENIWLTDNETYYEHCEIGDDPQDKFTDLHICDDPYQLDFYNILFLEFSAGKNDKTFERGKHYYFLSTSTGAPNTVRNRKGGHCRTHNMRLKVYVCKNFNETDPDCNYPDPQLNWYSATGAFLSAPIKTPLTTPLTTTAPANTAVNGTAMVSTIANGTVPVTVAKNDTAIVVTNTTGTAPVTMADNDTAIVVTTATGTAPVTMADNSTAIVMTTAAGATPVAMADNSTAIVMTTAKRATPVTMADNDTAVIMTTATRSAPVTMTDNSTAIVMTATATGSVPVTMTDNSTAIVMTTTATGSVPVTMTDNSTAIVMATTATGSVPARYDHSLAQPIRLVWTMGHNQSRTANIFEEEHYPVVAQCKEPNIRINLLNNKGTIANSWLCQKVGERLTILKPKYRNGDTYLFEASPKYRRLWTSKSKLSVNVISSRDYHTNNANTFYNPPVLVLLISAYFISASTL